MNMLFYASTVAVSNNDPDDPDALATRTEVVSAGGTVSNWSRLNSSWKMFKKDLQQPFWLYASTRNVFFLDTLKETADAISTVPYQTPTTYFLSSLPQGSVGSALVLPDGDVLLSNSAVIFRYNTTTHTLSNVATLPGPMGAMCYMRDGRVFIPSYSDAPEQPRIFDPVTNVLTTVSAFPADSAISKYRSSLSLPDGRIFLIPDNKLYPMVYDPIANTATEYTSHSWTGGSNYQSGVIVADGRLVCIGHETTVRVFDYTTNTTVAYTSTSGVPSVAGWGRNILLPDGRVFAPPTESRRGPQHMRACIFDPNTNTTTFGTTVWPSVPDGGGTYGRYRSCELLPDGNVFCCYAASTLYCLIYNPNTDTITPLTGASWMQSPIPNQQDTYATVTFTALDGSIYCVPKTSGRGFMRIVYNGPKWRPTQILSQPFNVGY